MIVWCDACPCVPRGWFYRMLGCCLPARRKRRGRLLFCHGGRSSDTACCKQLLQVVGTRVSNLNVHIRWKNRWVLCWLLTCYFVSRSPYCRSLDQYSFRQCGVLNPNRDFLIWSSSMLIPYMFFGGSFCRSLLLHFAVGYPLGLRSKLYISII